MSDLLWDFAELLTITVNIAGAFWYLHRKLGTRNPPVPRYVFGGLLVFLLYSLCYFFSVQDAIRLPLLVTACVIYALTTACGSKRQKVFHALIAAILVVISDAAVIALLTLLPNVTLGMIMNQTIYRVYAMIGSKLLTLFLIFLFSTRRSQEEQKTSYWMGMTSVPLISIAILTILVQYESLHGGHNSYALVAMSCGLFALTIILLLLHDRLAVNTRLLVEKEKMLQQSELQNRYFNETLAATDNMKGFRHDMKNHLQVLSGYLEMNNTAKARGYLNEIGSFISKNEFCVNSGYQLVDAVLGSKIAIAKKLGIEIECIIQLDREISIEQLDLCSILGNTMDNALEACERISGENALRSISIDLRSLESATVLTIANTVDPADAAVMDVLKSNKSGQGHGIGLAIVRRAVQKYKGTMEIAHEGTQFGVKIVIPAG